MKRKSLNFVTDQGCYLMYEPNLSDFRVFPRGCYDNFLSDVQASLHFVLNLDSGKTRGDFYCSILAVTNAEYPLPLEFQDF